VFSSVAVQLRPSRAWPQAGEARKAQRLLGGALAPTETTSPKVWRGEVLSWFIRQQPRPLDALQDAWLAAVAEHLARTDHLEIPYWAETQGLDLRHPFFAGKLQSLKARLTVESPTAFRRRMLFVSKDALFRPRAVRRDP
jgi:hypothetical protein